MTDEVPKCAECQKLREQNERYRAALETIAINRNAMDHKCFDLIRSSDLATQALKEVTDEKG